MKKGTITTIDQFNMSPLNRQRTIRIYLPPTYETSTENYPVIYMHDAQNLFDVNTSSFGSIWDIANTLDQRYEDKKQLYIVVGIDNGGQYRYDEYCPWESEIGGVYLPHAKLTNHLGGHGFEYASFIVNTLKPYIDTHYRTLTQREHTAIIGSSMGGLISMIIGLQYQHVFSKIGALSSAMYFAEDKIKEFIIQTGKKENMKIYMDVGTDETSNHSNKDFPTIYLNSNKAIYETLRLAGFQTNELNYNIIPNGKHNEDDWKQRFPSVIDSLF